MGRREGGACNVCAEDPPPLACTCTPGPDMSCYGRLSVIIRFTGGCLCIVAGITMRGIRTVAWDPASGVYRPSEGGLQESAH